jgi:copper(I)-binding protein
MQHLLQRLSTTTQKRSFHRQPPDDKDERRRRQRQRGWRCLLAVILTATSTSCGDPQQVSASGAIGADGRSGDILLRGVRIAAPERPQYPAGADADVWLTLLNEGRQPDTLTRVSSPAASMVIIRSDDACDGTVITVSTLTLAPASAVPGPAHSNNPSTADAFDSYSLQLVNLTRDVLAGTSVNITFQFRHAPSVTLAVPVRPLQAQDNPGHLCGSLPAATPHHPIKSWADTDERQSVSGRSIFH